MKLLTSFLFLIFISSTYAVAGSPELNECLALPATKKYITTDFQTYPRTVVFKCTYLCNSKNLIYSIQAISNVRINDMDEDAYMTVCQGVLVKITNWGYDFSKVEAFYAPDTKLKEIRKWAFKNIDFNPKTNALERTKLISLKQDLYQISSSFITVGSNGSGSTRYYLEAGATLAKIAEGLPMNTKKLDEVINRIKQPKTVKGNQARDLVDLYIKTSASWRIPPV